VPARRADLAPPAALLLTGLALFGSSMRATRIEVGGFFAHPALMALVFFTPFLVAPRVGRLPRGVVGSIVAVVASVSLVTLLGGSFPLGFTFKLGASGFMILATAALVTSSRAFDAGRAGLLFGVAAMAVQALVLGESEIGTTEFNPLQSIGNKNGFSLFALPALLLGGARILEPGRAWYARSVEIGACIAILLALMLTANRSGWVGAAIVALALATLQRGRRLQATVALSVIGALTAWILSTYLSTSVIEQRVELTVGGYSSDDLRRDLFVGCLRLGLENPLFGVGPQNVPMELAKLLRLTTAFGPHNAPAYLFALGGIAVVIPFAALAVHLLLATSRFRERASTHRTLQLLLVLWIVRSLFTDEILYSPSFGIAFGLLLGHGLLAPERRPFSGPPTRLPAK